MTTKYFFQKLSIVLFYACTMILFQNCAGSGEQQTEVQLDSLTEDATDADLEAEAMELINSDRGEVTASGYYPGHGFVKSQDPATNAPASFFISRYGQFCIRRGSVIGRQANSRDNRLLDSVWYSPAPNWKGSCTWPKIISMHRGRI